MRKSNDHINSEQIYIERIMLTQSEISVGVKILEIRSTYSRQFKNT